MSSSIFLSYPRPFKKRQEEFIGLIVIQDSIPAILDKCKS